MTGTASAERLLIGLPDIALLAKVRRPVVSMWRSRSAHSDRPFPAPSSSVRGRETFDALEVAAWLADTGRGNNPAAVEDVAAFAAIDGAGPRQDRAVFDALSALLCLKTLTTERLGELRSAGLLDLADQCDPDDEFLYAELVAVGDRLPALARYSDLLADAAFSPKDAFERLMADRWRSDLPEHVSATIALPALSLAARVAVDLTDRPGVPATYVDPTPGSSDLLLAVLAEHGDRSPVEVITAQGDGSNVRLVRRRLRVHDVFRAGSQVDDDGTFAVERAVTQVAQFPTPSSPVMSDVEILTTIENIALQMGDAQRGVVVAPASALCDNVKDRTVDGIRDGLLRDGHVHAVVRLPKGLVPARSRQALALWVLGAADRSTTAEDRFTTVADLANDALTAAAVTDLATDLAVATGSRALSRAHSFRFARAVPTRLLITARSSLVEVGGPVRRPDLLDPSRSADLLVRLETIRADIDEPADAASPRLPAFAAGAGQTPAPMSIGALIERNTLRVIGGTRLEDADVSGDAGIRVIDVDELTGAAVQQRAIDQLVLAARYPAARVTEPGDIVFCTSPRPAAMVDREGSALVAYPARVLRIDPADPEGLLPDLVAADINAMPRRAREWRLWILRRVADGQRRQLADALAELRRAREAALDRVTRLDLLTASITDGVAGGAIALLAADTATKGH